MKTCATCGVEAPATAKKNWNYCGPCRNDFKFQPGHPSYIDGGPICPMCDSRKAISAVTCGRKECRRVVHQAKKSAAKYGLNAVEVLWCRRRVACDCCGESFTGGRESRHIDHDHTTGKFRGVVCRCCNLAIGHAKENQARLRACADYLSGAKISGDIRGGSLGAL